MRARKSRKPAKPAPVKPANAPHKFGQFTVLPTQGVPKGISEFDPQSYGLDGSDGSDAKRRPKT